MADYPFWFTMITNNISSNSSHHVLVPFLLVALHWQVVGLDPFKTLGSTLVLTAFGREGLLWGVICDGEPHDLLHVRSDALVEVGNLALEVYQEVT